MLSGSKGGDHLVQLGAPEDDAELFAGAAVGLGLQLGDADQVEVVAIAEDVDQQLLALAGGDACDQGAVDP